MRRNNLLLVAAIVFLLFAAAVGICIRSLSSQESWSPIEYPLEQATWILQAIAAKTTKPLLNDLPTKIGFYMTEYGLDQCWNVLEEAMVRNNNQFTLPVARVYGKYGTPIPSPVGSTQVVIEVIFPNGTVIQMEYYNSTLEACPEMSDSK